MPTGGINIDCRWGGPPAVGERFTLSILGEDAQFVVVRVAEYARPVMDLDGVVSTHFVRFRRVSEAERVRRFGVAMR